MSRIVHVLALALLMTATWGIVRVEPATAGPVELQFTGRLVAEFLDDGRRVRLLESYTYVDSGGQVWDVPQGTVVDGASIPQLFWGLIGGPFEGKYRNASVVHDFYCERKTRPWEDVHRMFFDAMVESGVDEVMAKIMYYAVYFFGPRWETISVNSVGLTCGDAEDPKTCTAVQVPQLTTIDLPARAYESSAVAADVQKIIAGDLRLEDIEKL